jgi:3-deoxy-D-manno-octulosonate 8-phosphate phosphatase (KDO 8-P phosphatase)
MAKRSISRVGLVTSPFDRRAGQLEWILSDVDGVLTDGRIYLDGRGEAIKAFHVHDGLGIKMARSVGLKVGLLSARSSAPLERRASQLGIDVLLAGQEDKGAAFDAFLARHQVPASRVAYIGDDLNDLVVLARCGLSFAPADAVAEVRDVVQVVLESAGGRGAVREMIESILRARGDWQGVLSAFSLER